MSNQSPELKAVVEVFNRRLLKQQSIDHDSVYHQMRGLLVVSKLNDQQLWDMVFCIADFITEQLPTLKPPSRG